MKKLEIILYLPVFLQSFGSWKIFWLQILPIVLDAWPPAVFPSDNYYITAGHISVVM